MTAGLADGLRMRTVLVTHATHYAGPGAVEVLGGEGLRLVCHDPSFADDTVRREFQARFAAVHCLVSVEPEAMRDELQARGLDIDAVVSNDVHAIRPAPIGDIALDELRSTFEAVLAFPVRLTQALLPGMKARGSGCFVFVTSARPLRPETGFAVPTALRAAASSFALALAREVGPCGIQVNVVAPNYLASEMYYPRARFVDDPAGRALIASVVPMGRLGTAREVGELIAFLVSGRSAFVTGQVIHFTGGWP